MFDPSKTVMIAWKKAARRSELLSKALEIKIWLFPDGVPYIRAFLNTLHRVVKQKPRIIILQLPQGPLLLEGVLLKMLTKCKIVVDVHTGFLINTDWKGLLLNAPFLKFLDAIDLIIVHNEFQLNLIPPKLRGKTVVTFDPWYLILDSDVKFENTQSGYVVFPASFASDEPISEVIKSVEALGSGVKMYITGNWGRQPKIIEHSSERIIFTGYLSTEEYYKLISKSTAVIAGTKREYTSLMSAWEAVTFGKPLALSDSKTLRSLFQDYAVFYNWEDIGGIIAAIERILISKPNELVRDKLRERTLRSLEILISKLGQLD